MTSASKPSHTRNRSKGIVSAFIHAFSTWSEYQGHADEYVHCTCVLESCHAWVQVCLSNCPPTPYDLVGSWRKQSYCSTRNFQENDGQYRQIYQRCSGLQGIPPMQFFWFSPSLIQNWSGSLLSLKLYLVSVIQIQKFTNIYLSWL